MECDHCKGTMIRGFAPFHIDREGRHISLDKVPAWVCTQCGEALFERPEVEAIQAMEVGGSENIAMNIGSMRA